MRGKQIVDTHNVDNAGLIPAHAGKTNGFGAHAKRCRAHPRACGENKLLIRIMSIMLGSSPRMRGKPTVLERTLSDVGLIPAHAGKTHPGAGTGCLATAHPRACGENRGYDTVEPCTNGSSPRMRGKLATLVAARRTAGLIPAHAGKTPCSPPARPAHRAHPRACGENGDCVP